MPGASHSGPVRNFPGPGDASNPDRPRYPGIKHQTVFSGGLKWRVRLDLPEQIVPEILENPDAWLSDPAHLYKNSRVVTIGKIPPTSWRPPLVLRRLNYGKWVHRVKDMVRPSRAQRGLSRAWALESSGIRSPRGWAAADDRRWLAPKQAYLLTEQIVGGISLARLLISRANLTPELFSSLATALACLHARGFLHQDLKLSNIIYDSEKAPWFIDVDGVARARFDSGKVQNVVVLWRNILNCCPDAQDYLDEFLKIYHRERGAPHLPDLHSRILGKTDRA